MYETLFIATFFLSQVLLFQGTRGNWRIFYYVVPWTMITGFLSFMGFFEIGSRGPLRFILIFFGVVVICFLLLRLVKNKKVDINYLLSVHVLRVPVEIVLYRQYLLGKVPKLMTFLGWNFDILIGMSALLLLFNKTVLGREPSHGFLLVWNWLGIFFLTIIVLLAVLSSPTPLQLFAFDCPNIAVLEFPYIWLPALIVPTVFLAHWLSIKNIST